MNLAPKEFQARDIYIDYPFESAKFRWDKEAEKVYRRTTAKRRTKSITARICSTRPLPRERRLPAMSTFVTENFRAMSTAQAKVAGVQYSRNLHKHFVPGLTKL